jgi:hypothetical protein
MASSATSTNVALTIEMLQNKKERIPMSIKLHLISRNENLQTLLGNIIFLSKQNTSDSSLLTAYKNKFMHLIYVDLIKGHKNREFLGIETQASNGLFSFGNTTPSIKTDFQNYYDKFNTTP